MFNSRISYSTDPNDKTVQEGFGEKGYVTADATLNYKVEFENEADASAPARWVRVYDVLADEFDVSTFELKSICIAGNYIEVGDGRDSFNETRELNILGETVLTKIAVNLEENDDGKMQIFAEFTAIDPETGFMEQDVTKGLLFPEDESGRGQGFFEYDIALKDGVEHNAAIENTAKIYFDFNDPIDTPTTLNTVDSVNPILTQFELVSDDSGITISVDGADADSGIYGYRIAYSADGVNFYALATTTENTYTVDLDSASGYSFIVQAVDNVGNVSDWSEALVARSKENDDWADLKSAGPDGNFDVFRKFASDASYTDQIGKDDPVDYRAVTLDSAASLSFTVSSENAAKFTIYSLQSKTDKKGVTTYSLKSLQSTSLKAGQEINTKSLLLDKGTYYIGVDNSDKKKSDADYTVTVNANSVFFTKGDNGDDWTTVKTEGAAGLAASAGTVTESGDLLSGWVGYGDAVDYTAVTLDSAANLAFDLSVTDAAKFTVYSLQSKTDKKGVTTYSLKSLQSTSVKKGDATTKNLLLEKGTYYIAMESTNAKKGGSVDYTVGVSDKTTFFTKGDNGDDWTTVKTEGAAGLTASAGTVTESGDLLTGWVGYGDAVDYTAITIDSAANLSFDLNATDAAKFTVYTLQSKTDKNGVTTYSLKSLQSTTLKADKDATTKNLLLEKGTYYIAMESTNAKKGGSADYTVSVDTKTTFFTKGDNSDDWTTVKTDGAVGLAASVGTVAASGELLSGWVGYGDAVDYTAITLDSAANLAFDLSATDAAKFTVYALQSKTDKKGVTTYSLKSLQSTTLKAGKDATTKNLLLEKGTYYIAMESTNAKKGGSADYTVSVDEKTTFFTKGDNGDDWTDLKTAGAASLDEPLTLDENTGDLLTGWVGYGDAVDYRAFTLDTAANLAFDLNVTDAAKFTVYSLQGKTDKKGETTYSLKSLQSTTLKAGDTTTKSLSLGEGTYYLAMESTNAKKGGSADYRVSLDEASTFAPKEDAVAQDLLMASPVDFDLLSAVDAPASQEDGGLTLAGSLEENDPLAFDPHGDTALAMTDPTDGLSLSASEQVDLKRGLLAGV